MARILYALSGANRGHTSRVLAVTEELRARGHKIGFCGGGRAHEILEGLGERVIKVPAILQVMDNNKVRLWDTAKLNFTNFARRGAIAASVLPELEAFGPDLVISDFEQYAARAAEQLGIPVLSFNHQQIVTETVYDVPARFRVERFLTAATINRIAPQTAVHNLVSSFFFPPVKDPRRTTLIPPILRGAVRRARPEKGEHTLVYVNQPEGATDFLNVLESANEKFIVYGCGTASGWTGTSRVVLRPPSMEQFLEDLATARAVITTAGYTLMSEALHLGKPLLVLPNSGTFEQTINALFLEREGLGEAVYERAMTVEDIRGFFSRLEQYEAVLPFRPVGNRLATTFIEEVLRTRPVLEPTPAFEAALQP